MGTELDKFLSRTPSAPKSVHSWSARNEIRGDPHFVFAGKWYRWEHTIMGKITAVPSSGPGFDGGLRSVIENIGKLA